MTRTDPQHPSSHIMTTLRACLSSLLLLTASGTSTALAFAPGTQSDITFNLTLSTTHFERYPDGSDGDPTDGYPDYSKLSNAKYAAGKLVSGTWTSKQKLLTAKYTTKHFLTDLLQTGRLADGETSIAGWSIVYLTKNYDILTGNYTSTYEPGFYAIKKSGKNIVRITNLDESMKYLDYDNYVSAYSGTSIYKSKEKDDSTLEESATYNQKSKTLVYLGFQVEYEYPIYYVQGILNQNVKYGPVKLGKETVSLETSSAAKIASITGQCESTLDDVPYSIIEGSINFGKSKAVDLDALLNDNSSSVSGSLILSGGNTLTLENANLKNGTLTINGDSSLLFPDTTTHIPGDKDGQGNFIIPNAQTLNTAQPNN